MDMDFDQFEYAPKEIKVSTLLKIFGIGAATLVAATTLGYFWSGRKSFEEIREQARQEKERSKEGRRRGGPNPAGEMDMESMMPPMVNSAQSKAEAANQRTREIQRELVAIIGLANQQYAKGVYEKAALLYQEALRAIPKNIPQYDDFALDIIPKLVKCFIEMNKLTEADQFLTSIKPSLSENPETQLNFNYIRAQVLDFLNKDKELEALILSNMQKSKDLFGEKSINYVNQLFVYGSFLIKQKKYEQAIPHFQSCLDFHTATGAPPSTEEFQIFRQIQRCHLNLGQKDKAMLILDGIKVTAEDPISIAWQIHHTAILLLETGYKKDSENLFLTLLSEHEVPDNGEFSNARIKALVSNTISEYSIFLFNEGREEDAEKYFNMICHYKWGVLSNSLYLSTKQANIYFAPKPDQAIGFSARITCDFSLSKLIKEGMLIEIESETLDGIDISSHIIEDGQLYLSYKGNETTKIENKVYRVIVRIYSDVVKSKLLFTHFQFVPSSIDTTSMRQWSEIESAFKNKK